MSCHRLFLTVSFLLLFFSLTAQENRTVAERCGTMQRLERKMRQNAAFKARFEQKKIEFNRIVSSRSLNKSARLNGAVFIPVVFHIVMPNPSLVTDAQIQAQLDTLNKDFFGANADSIKIPSYFKSLFGKSSIQFCLAQRTPDGEPTTGIERKITTKTSFTWDDGVKHGYSGGTESWNPDKYLNVWVCPMSNGLLGYATPPDDGSPEDQGVVVEYKSLPGGSLVNFNTGKTLTHETGHYFNLYHIWGDTNSNTCADSDFVDDTPNQYISTSGCLTGVQFDNCTSGGNGIMYQNYMDYSDDPCLVMFTKGQVERMETALSVSRTSLLSSNGCQPVILSTYDVQLRSVNQPFQRLCGPAFTPQVTIKNRGLQNLTSLQISTKIDNGPVTVYQWTGSLTSFNLTTINLNNLTTTPGNHTLTIYVSNPNNNTDQDQTNDTITINFQYVTPVTQVKEGFENTVFPPQGWDVVNRDNALTWEHFTGISKTGNRSVGINNFDYDHVGEMDDLRMPLISIPGGLDSAFLSFEVAATTFTNTGDVTNPAWDTLEVLVSKDCGNTYTTVYKKWGKDLVTAKETTAPFFPSSSEWRKDSIDLSSFIGNNNLLVSFRNTTGFENYIFLDDINLRTVSVLPNLKTQGFLITPNPTNGPIVIQFYPESNGLQGIQLFNSIGQKIREIKTNSSSSGNYYSFDISNEPSGMYTVRVVFKDRVLTKKMIKL
jgi:hypothetical protein